MNVLSLFDGISCGQIALERAKVKVCNYFASEVDKHAIYVTQKNYPKTIQLGDVRSFNEWKIDWSSIDLVIGGSPCQGFSLAGKRKGFKDPRSNLFFCYTACLNKARIANPKLLYLLENVCMQRKFQDVISAFLINDPLRINSKLVSAQNRPRLYWTNLPNILEPGDRGIYLKDIIDRGIAEIDKSYNLDVCNKKLGDIEEYMVKAREQIPFEPFVFRAVRTEQAKRIRREFRRKYKRDYNPFQAKKLEPRVDGKTNCITANINKKEWSLIDEK